VTIILIVLGSLVVMFAGLLIRNQRATEQVRDEIRRQNGTYRPRRHVDLFAPADRFWARRRARRASR
jgi:hypothetical protein